MLKQNICFYILSQIVKMYYYNTSHIQEAHVYIMACLQTTGAIYRPFWLREQINTEQQVRGKSRATPYTPMNASAILNIETNSFLITLLYCMVLCYLKI